MAAPGSLVAQHQRHEVFRRSAKELLSIRHTNADPKVRLKRVVERLEKQFQHQKVRILVRYPNHYDITVAKIPIVQRGKFFDVNYPMSIKIRGGLPVSGFERCEVVLQMPGGLDLLVSRQYKAENRVTL